MLISVKSPDELPEAALSFLKALGNRRVVAFHGEMGAGKTTFIAELCKKLGVKDIAASPSFAIINEYVMEPSRLPIYHFDFYRLDSPEEAVDIGAEDYFYSGNLCLIEWPERVESILPEDAVQVAIEVNPLSGERTISLPEE